MKLSIIIPVFNNLSFTKAVVQSIQENLYYRDSFELIIINNGSTDGTTEYLNGLMVLSYIYVVQLKENIYVNPAWNLGAKLAEGEYLLFLNNDITIPKDLDKKMVEAYGGKVVCSLMEQVGSNAAAPNINNINGTCFLIKKTDYTPIPEQMKIRYGDDYLYRMLGCTRIEEHNLHRGSQTIKIVSEAGPVIQNDVIEFTKLCIERGWEDNRFHDTIKEVKLDRWELMNNWERNVFLKGEPITHMEYARYERASKNILGTKVLEIGCSNGYGTQILPKNIDYLGLDYDKRITEVANAQFGDANHKFEWADINTYELGQYDTIIAFEVIEHLKNGMKIAQKLKKHCKRLLISAPYNEPITHYLYENGKRLQPVGPCGKFHVLHHLIPWDFPGFDYKFINADGNVADNPIIGGLILMLMKYNG